MTKTVHLPVKSLICLSSEWLECLAGKSPEGEDGVEWDAAMGSAAGEGCLCSGCISCAPLVILAPSPAPHACITCLGNRRFAIAGPDAGGGASLPSVPGWIPEVAEEAMLLAEAAEGAKQSHRGEQHYGHLLHRASLNDSIFLGVKCPVLSDTCLMFGIPGLSKELLIGAA